MRRNSFVGLTCGIRFSKIKQLTVEFHDFLYPELKNQVEELKQKISSFGFYCIPFSLTTNGDVLFIRKVEISFAKYILVKYILRYIRGVIRKARKILS